MRAHLARHARLARLALVCAVAATLFRAGDSRAETRRSDVTWSRNASDPRWVQGHVVIAAPPDEVFARLVEVDRWPQTFTDIAKMRVKSRPPSNWMVDLETRTLGHGTLPYHVDIGPGRKVRFWTNGSGVRAAGETVIREGATPTQSEVDYGLFIELSGLPALALPEHTLRPKQEHMVVAQLTDLSRAFPN